MPIIYEPDATDRKFHSCDTPGGSFGGVRMSGSPPGSLWQCPECNKYWVAKKFGYTHAKWERVRWYDYFTQVKIQEFKSKEKKK